MTATTKSPRRRRRASADSPLMDTLGFSDSTTSWSDRPPAPTPVRTFARPAPVRPTPPPREVKRGRHERPESELPAPPKDWDTTEVQARFTGGDFRWVRFLAIVLIIGGLASGVYWFYLNSAQQPGEARADVIAQASLLTTGVQSMAEAVNEMPAIGDSTSLGTIEQQARDLFTASGALDTTDTALSSSAGSITNNVLSSTSLLQHTWALQRAVGALTIEPPVETEPALIELDEAISGFGIWADTLSSTTLSVAHPELQPVADAWASFTETLDQRLVDYSDAMRDDDEVGVRSVIAGINGDLRRLDQTLNEAVMDVAEMLRETLARTAADLESMLS